MGDEERLIERLKELESRKEKHDNADRELNGKQLIDKFSVSAADLRTLVRGEVKQQFMELKKICEEIVSVDGWEEFFSPYYRVVIKECLYNSDRSFIHTLEFLDNRGRK